MVEARLVFAPFFALHPHLPAAQEFTGAFEALLAASEPAHPRNTEADIVVLKAGSLLLAWSDFHGGTQDAAPATISAATSRDGGRTWSPRYTLQPNMGGRNVMSVSLLRTRSGDILFFFADKRRATECDFYVRRSSDEGATWGPPFLITPDPGEHLRLHSRARGDGAGRGGARGRTQPPGDQDLHRAHLAQPFPRRRRHLDPGGGRGRGVARVAQHPRPDPRHRGSAAHLEPQSRWEAHAPGAAISSDGGEAWSEPIALESDLAHTCAYVSVTFDGLDALLTQYVDENSLKFRRVPVHAFYGEVSIRPAAGFRPPSVVPFRGRDILGRLNLPRTPGRSR